MYALEKYTVCQAFMYVLLNIVLNLSHFTPNYIFVERVRNGIYYLEMYFFLCSTIYIRGLLL